MTIPDLPSCLLMEKDLSAANHDLKCCFEIHADHTHHFWYNEEKYKLYFEMGTPQQEHPIPTKLRPSMEVVWDLNEGNPDGLVGAEIGIGSCHNLACILNGLDIKKMYCVDWGSDGNADHVTPEIKKHFNKIEFIKKNSHEAHQDIPDNSLDFCYIDACHDYPDVLADIQDYYPKVKEGGVLCGHDYNLKDVNRVVNLLWMNMWRLQNKRPTHGYGSCPDDHPGVSMAEEYKKCGFPLDWWYLKEKHIDDLKLVELRNT